MWMWHRRFKKDVFCTNVMVRENKAVFPWYVLWWDELRLSWDDERFDNFEPPHEH